MDLHGADADPVAASIIDKWDAEQRADLLDDHIAFTLLERLNPESPQVVPEVLHRRQPLGLDAHDVLAAFEVAGMRARTREEDRMGAFLQQGGVIPTSPEVVAVEIMRSIGYPLRRRGTVGLAVEIDESLLPVGFVVVYAVETGPPVVHGIKIQVVQDDPVTLSKRPAIIDRPAIDAVDFSHPHIGRGRRAAGNHAAHSQ